MTLFMFFLSMSFTRVKGGTDALDQITLTTANRDGDYVTLYKMPLTAGFSDNAAGVEQYRQICESYHPDVKMVGCGTSSYPNCTPEENCIPMPSSWGCNMLTNLYTNTEWNSIVALQVDSTDHPSRYLYAYNNGPHHPSAGNSYHAVCGSIGAISRFTYHIIDGYRIENIRSYLSTEFPSWVESESYNSNVDLVIILLNSSVDQSILDDIESRNVRVALMRASNYANQFDSAYTSASATTGSITITANHPVLTEGFTVGQNYNLGFTYKSFYTGVGSNYQELATIGSNVVLAFHKSRPIVLVPYYGHNSGSTGNSDGQRIIRNVFQWLWHYGYYASAYISIDINSWSTTYGTTPTTNYRSSGCVGANTDVAGAVYDVTIARAGEYIVTIDWGSSSYNDKSYVQWNSPGTVGSNIILATDSNENGKQSSSPVSLSAGSHLLHIGSNSDGGFYTVPWCDITIHSTEDVQVLGYVDDSSCQWHEMNKMNKVINSNQFFGFECPANQIISDLRLEGYGARSVLENNPTAILCCELGGYSVVTNTCVDSYSTADGVLEAAICQGNSAMAAIYDLSDPSLEQNQWQYQATKGITCCDIEFDTTYGHNRDLGIDRSQCEIISHSNQVGSFDVSCPVDMVLVEIRDNDIAHGVQEVHEIECCRVHQATAPTKAPTITPTTSQPSSAPTSSCYHCLIGVHARDVRDQDDFVGEINACLSHCCA